MSAQRELQIPQEVLDEKRTIVLQFASLDDAKDAVAVYRGFLIPGTTQVQFRGGSLDDTALFELRAVFGAQKYIPK